MYENQKKDIFDRIMDLGIFSPVRGLYYRYKEILMYLFFGVLSTIVSIGSFAWCAVPMKMDPLIANIISWILAVTFAYVTNKIWVFHSVTESFGQLVKEGFNFYVGRLATLGVEEAILFIGINLMGFDSVLVKVVAQVVIVILNYVISKIFVFKGKEA